MMTLLLTMVCTTGCLAAMVVYGAWSAYRDDCRDQEEM